MNGFKFLIDGGWSCVAKMYTARRQYTEKMRLTPSTSPGWMVASDPRTTNATNVPSVKSAPDARKPNQALRRNTLSWMTK